MENKVLAVVNGKEITEATLNSALAKFPPERRSQLTSGEGKKYLLDQVIAWELLYTYALDEGLENREEFKTQIEEAKREILSQIAVNDIISNIKVSNEEVEEYYNANKEKFTEDAKVKASHILVDSEEKANEIVEEIKSGLSFKDAADKYSSCPSKAQGGSLGSFGRGMMVPEFEEAAFALELGKVSEPVKTQFGYHIIVVEEKLPAREKSLQEVDAQIMSMLIQQKQGSSYMNLIEGLKSKYSLEIK
ncbi:peptidylprolyl isomerase [Clostridium cylindrosporum]|uniref:Putative peptidyl-prolyl cis-trans isomerase Cbf2 n=1 Tax=Clostridium cylindrosporum DSM 605 TaxID=1121307 RepID=A0A0J8DAB4_CLOCY|nr:peptidylprolyl isomerase [Clostridium cylindrosporum]KMT21243.1 putative peptidyl-prolyl cis-trans isomerase Cbf2 [Clostridium cylindrosporum DSM 605]